MGHVDAPKINHLVMIDSHRLEIYWDQDIVHDNLATNYQITQLATPVEIDTDCSEADGNWATRPVYEPGKKRVTLYLLNPIHQSELNQLCLQVNGQVTNEYGSAADCTIHYQINHWQTFYTRFTQSHSGIIVKSSNQVTRETHRKAVQIIDTQLAKIPAVAQKMIEHGADLAIYGHGEDVYDIPEHRGGASILGRPVEGFGGCADDPTTSISEANVLRITEGPTQTRYLNECIMVHEFGHAIHLVGIKNLKDQSIANELLACYEHAKAHGLWPNTYIISNYEEYFATLSTIWFNVMAESVSGTWDGVRGPINTREELKLYDPQAYAFLAKIYNPVALPAPWDRTPVFFPDVLAKIKDGTIHDLPKVSS